MRVLLAFEEECRPYCAALAAAIRTFRPDVEVAIVGASELEAEVERFDPQLAILSPPALPKDPVGEELPGWIELSPETAQPPARFRVGERAWESGNPTLREILSAVDETKGLCRRTSRT